MEDVSYWWQLEFKDGDKIDIRPEYVPAIKKQLKEQAFITTRDWSRSVSTVKSLVKTSRPVSAGELSAPLEEEAAKAFKEPIIEQREWQGRKYDVIICKWVKMPITPREWTTVYSKRAGFHLLDREWVAFMQPIHTIDDNKHTELTTEEMHKIGVDN